MDTRIETVAGDTGIPLPLRYVMGMSGKHTESVMNVDQELDSKVKKTKRTPLAAIGNPLPLNYLKKVPKNVEVVKEVEEGVKVETTRPEKHHNLRLSDLGVPLPLNYHSSKQEDIPDEKEAIEQPIDDKRIAIKYDFGAPLPLHYVNNKPQTLIATETFKWKQPNTGHYDVSDNSNDMSQSDTSQEIANDVLQNESDIKDDVLEESSANGTIDLDPVVEPADDTDTINIEIQEYIHTNNYKALVDRVDNAEFRLKLIRHMRQLKRQYDLLNKVLQPELVTEESVESGCSTITVTDTVAESCSVPRAPMIRVIDWGMYLYSALLSTAFFVLICVISYFLAD